TNDLEAALATADTKLSGAEEQLAKLRGVQADLEAEAGKAAVAAAREPTEQAVVHELVMSKKAAKQKELADDFAAKAVAPLKEAANKARNAKRHGELAREYPESAVAALLQRLVDVGIGAVVEFSERP